MSAPSGEILTTAAVLGAEFLIGFAAAFAAIEFGGLTTIQAMIIGWLAGITVGVAVYGWP